MTAPRGLASAGYRIVIVEDHVLFAEALELTLGVEGHDVRRVRVPESGASTAALLAAILRTQPRLVLLDLDLGPFGDAAPLIGPLARAGVNVVVVTASEDKARWGRSVSQGARKVISKGRPLAEIMATVRKLRSGAAVMDVRERQELVGHWTRTRAEDQEARLRVERLTPREAVVLSELMEGRTVKEIAARSVVAEATVRTQVKSILAKLEVSSQLAAVGIAHRIGWRPASH